MTPLGLVAGLVLVNIATVLAFYADKQRAIRGDYRISESTLLTLAAFGGSPGALVARRIYRHKTRKQPFSAQLLLICAIQASAALGLAIF